MNSVTSAQVVESSWLFRPSSPSYNWIMLFCLVVACVDVDLFSVRPLFQGLAQEDTRRLAIANNCHRGVGSTDSVDQQSGQDDSVCD